MIATLRAIVGWASYNSENSNHHGKRMKHLVVLSILLMFTTLAEAKPAFTGQNYSGVYTCTGSNDFIGDYKVKVTLKLNRISSYGKLGAYFYEMETENSASYNGHAIADGNRLSLTLQTSDRRSADSSIGYATMKKDTKGRWTFRKNYYEPNDNGGTNGTEFCVLELSLVNPKRPKGSTPDLP